MKKVIMAIFTYALAMLLPIVAGQWTRNQGRKLHRVLARLYNTMILNGKIILTVIEELMREQQKQESSLWE